MITRLNATQELEGLRQQILASRNQDTLRITVCCGTGCIAQGAKKVVEAFKRELSAQNVNAEVAELKETGCHGFCEQGPIVVIRPQDIFYKKVQVEDVPKIVARTIINGEVMERLLYSVPGNKKEKCTQESQIPFYAKQERVVFKNNAYIDPTSIEDYIAVGGYASLVKVLTTLQSQQVIDTIIDSGLRGRGGGGFPTGWKWQSSKDAAGDIKFVVCNCDEGDPGAFMDRSIMEGNPHLVLEGMLIAAYAVGNVSEAYIYIRNEYPYALKHAYKAIEDAKAYGLLGDNILSTGFNLDIKICRGGGAFVCGESTALMASIEGKVGEPRAKYVHTSEKGLWGRPTVLNNVETLANVPVIFEKGVEWYKSIGTEGSKGTKVFALVGKVNNTGLVEVPMGISLREVIMDIGGGVPNKKQFKAVQTGGPSGGCLPESKLDLAVDFDELTKNGSMMGSGAMVVMDERNCMVDTARYFIEFLEEESCGKCTPCREGLRAIRNILMDICSGKAELEDIDRLEKLCLAVTEGSLCQLGGTAANPVLSTLKYFRSEYEEHITNKYCRAGVCKDLIAFYIKDNCPGCVLCYKACPTGAIIYNGKGVPVTLIQDKCTKCGACLDVCNLDALEVRSVYDNR